MAAFTLVYGTLGLCVEWFLIGNSPWGNPDAAQWAMFAYWACMGLVPAVFLEEKGRWLKLGVAVLVAAYVVLVGLGQMLPGPGLADKPPLRFVFNILSVMFGYTVLMLVCGVGLVCVSRREASKT